MTPPKVLYEVRSYALNGGRLHTWGSSYSRDEAEEKKRRRSEGDQAEWAEKYHRDWHIAEIDVRGMFVIPPKELPRERFLLKNRLTKPDGWGYHECAIVEAGSEKVVAEWTYTYPGRPPYEPFRQGDRHYALMATNYTGTSVMDLQTGEIIAAEPDESWGFCPVGFYVPDWWDVHDGSIKPGSTMWDPKFEQPSGQYGFVWGCVWGDDSSWKVQYLDLSDVQNGVIRRDDRFGYVPLAVTDNVEDFIRVGYDTPHVTFAVQRTFNLATGKALDE